MADVLLPDLLQPLLTALQGGRQQRIVARPGLVMLDRPEGSAPLLVEWDAAQHARALELVPSSVTLAEGVTVSRVGDVLVVQNPANPQRRSDDWAREGGVSTLAARLLSAALGLGKNVLIVGRSGPVEDAIAALLADGKRPVVVGPEACAVPRSWVRIDDLAALPLYGADRVGAWLATPAQVAALMTSHSGVIAALDARKLDRALMRFENALALHVGQPATPLHVLSALDLVVVMGETRVTEIYEINLNEEGYRPRPLFLSGLPPAPQALVPVSPPSFLGDLAPAGFSLLADELRHAVPVAQTRPEPRHEPIPEPVIHPRRDVLPPPVVDSPPPLDFGPESEAMMGFEPHPAPGDEPSEDDNVPSTSDDAVLAARFGLGPPPRPTGVRPEGASFEEALRRARMREGGQE